MNIYKLLGFIYLILILPVPFIYPGDTTSLINLSLPLFYFACLHWAVSNNLSGLRREKLFVFSSLATLVYILVMVMFFFLDTNDGWMFLASVSIFPIPVAFTLFYGLFSLFRTNKRMFYMFMLSIPVLLCIIFFVSSDLHRGPGSEISKLFRFLRLVLLWPFGVIIELISPIDIIL